MVPVIETVIFSALTRIYSIPLFAEDVVECNSTYQEGQGYMHLDSHQKTVDFWKSEGKNLCLDELVDHSELQ